MHIKSGLDMQYTVKYLVERMPLRQVNTITLP